MVGDLVVRLDQKTHTIRGAYLSLLADIDNDPTRLPECGARAAVILEEENDGSEVTAPFAATMPPAPKLRADGQPRQKPGRKPKVHVAPVTSPLTAELRAKLEATLSRGPMTLEALTRMSWAADVKDIEGLLCEDPETFVRWTDYGSKEGRVVWGLVEHFDRAVGMLTLQCAKSERGKFTAEALGCSVYQALGAWKRLDPEGT